MLEKLALLKIAFCRAPAFSSTSSACLRELTWPAPSVTPTRVLVSSFPLAMVLSPVTCTALCRFNGVAGAFAATYFAVLPSVHRCGDRAALLARRAWRGND